jgi:hypothetical protein
MNMQDYITNNPETIKSWRNFAVSNLQTITNVSSMVTFKECVDVFSFIFFLTSPLTSYGDQILAMHRRKSSAGFSIDVSGIMLTARYPLDSPELSFRSVSTDRDVGFSTSVMAADVPVS